MEVHFQRRAHHTGFQETHTQKKGQHQDSAGESAERLQLLLLKSAEKRGAFSSGCLQILECPPTRTPQLSGEGPRALAGRAKRKVGQQARTPRQAPAPKENPSALKSCIKLETDKGNTTWGKAP